MFFHLLKRYPLLSRLTLMQACLAMLCYSLFLSAELETRLAKGFSAITASRENITSDPVYLIQLLLAGLFVSGCRMTLRSAYRSLVSRTDLALSYSKTLDSGASLKAIHATDEVDRLALTLEKTVAHLSARLTEEAYNAEQARTQERFASATLDFIHRTSLSLSEQSLNTSSANGLIEDMAQSLGAETCTLALLEPVATGLAMPQVIASPQPARILESSTLQELCRENRQKRVHAEGESESEVFELAVPLRDATDTYGVLIVEIRANFLFENRQIRVANTVAGLLALSLGNQLRNQRRRRLALMDERNAIAGELHDSLAQALAYMRIQVACLQKELDRSCNRCNIKGNVMIHEVAGEIRTGLDNAYRHLRELLTAFRTNMPPGSLQQALREVVDELGARAETDITLDYRLGNLALSVNEEFQLLQIVREALTNVVRHARAQQASVSLEIEDDGLVRLQVEDDGRGADKEAKKEGHYGLSIMNERAQQLGGSCQLLAARPDGRGMRVLVRFQPRTQQD
jgi:two-component system, NarL family, nitrate/nitrite sensor histidine kinase NarX